MGAILRPFGGIQLECLFSFFEPRLVQPRAFLNKTQNDAQSHPSSNPFGRSVRPVLVEQYGLTQLGVAGAPVLIGVPVRIIG